jgi:hypothetical protein
MLDVVVLAIVMESTILFELIAVRPSLSPVIACEPIDSLTAFAAIMPAETFVKGILYSYGK